MSNDALPPDRSDVATEQAHPSSPRLDEMATADLVGFLASDQARAIEAVCEVVDEIAELVDVVVAALSAGGRLVYVGAGTSGRLGVLDASECPPTFNSDPEQVLGLIAGGEKALRRSSEGAEDDPSGIDSEFQRLQVGAGDVVVGLAAGGTTPWVLGALQRGHASGARTAMMSCAWRECPPGCEPVDRHCDGS